MTATPESLEAAQKRLAEEKPLTERSRQEFAERMKGKPTPTQEENDLAACGAHFLEHEDDGSGPDPHSAAATRQMEAGKGATYQTRQVGAARPGASTPPARPRTE